MKYFLIILLSIPFVVSAQDRPDCLALLDESLPLDTETREWDSEALLEGTSLLFHCFFDEYDRKALAKDPFYNFLIELSVQEFDRVPTYRDMKQYFQGVTEGEEYQRIKAGGEVAVTFGNTIADTATFRQDIQLIQGIIPSQELLNDLYALTVQYQGQGKTYGYLLDLHRAGVEAERKDLPDPFRALDYEGGAFPYEAALEEARSSGKPLLIFFTGYALVNGVKMGDAILEKPEFRKILLSDFVCLRFYVDSSIELAPEHQLKVGGDNPRTLRTVGQRAAYFQQEQFGANYQPYFVIVNGEGKVLAEQGYTIDPDEFRAFLDKAR